MREWICDPGDPVIPGLLSAVPGSTIDPELPPEGIIQVNAASGARLFISRSSLVGVGIDDLGTPASNVIARPAPVAVIKDFLPPPLVTRLLTDCLAREAAFSPATVAKGDAKHRSARVLYDFPTKTEIEQAIRARLAASIAELELPTDTSGRMEMQLTASNDGDYYHAHVDNGADSVSTRLAAHVFYFHRRPRRFAGGTLRLFDLRTESGHWVPAKTFRDIEPEHNMLVLFPAQTLHEVRPVLCTSRAFADSRFTVNGWLHSPERRD